MMMMNKKGEKKRLYLIFDVIFKLIEIKICLYTTLKTIVITNSTKLRFVQRLW